MKRLISIFLLLVMLLSPVTAYAADDSIRHEVYGDVSEIEVSGEQSVGKVNEDNTQATMGTEMWLFVDPDTASYVSFFVTDEDGKPLKDALVYISYNGKSELYGATDEDGLLKCYLFRDTEYGFTVTKDGFETAEGKFSAAKETKTVRVVLRKYYNVEILVVDGDKAVANTEVYIDGIRYVTDKDGKVTVQKTNGIYDAVVITEDGRQIPVRFKVDRGAKEVIDIGLDDSIVPGGRASDGFLVYDKNYDPEDYVLTEYVFLNSDVEEKQADRYLDQVRNTLVIEAQPQRIQNKDGSDSDLMRNNRAVYSRRSLMPTGFLIKSWEKQGMEKLLFTNEDMGISFDLASLHNEKMMKLYGAMWYFSEYKVTLKDIATQAVQKKWNGYSRSGLNAMQAYNLAPEKIPFEAIRDFRFDFTLTEQEREKAELELLPEELFTNSLFEFIITPIDREAMREIISDGLKDKGAFDSNEIMLASWGYFKEELRRHLAEGRLSEMEFDELYAYFVDSKLSKDEIKELKKQLNDGKLSQKAIDAMLEAVDSRVYRVESYVHYGNMNVNITSLLSDLRLYRKADEFFKAEYDRLYEEELTKLAKDQKPDEKKLEEMAEKAVAEGFDFMLVELENQRWGMYDYKAGELTDFVKPELIRSLDEKSEFVDVIKKKEHRELTVDVRLERDFRFKAHISQGRAQLEQHRAIVADRAGSMLAALEIN